MLAQNWQEKSGHIRFLEPIKAGLVHEVELRLHPVGWHEFPRFVVITSGRFVRNSDVGVSNFAAAATNGGFSGRDAVSIGSGQFAA